MRQCRGQWNRAGRLDDLLQVTPGQCHRLDDPGFRHAKNIDLVALQNVEVAHPDQRPQTVGNRVGCMLIDPAAQGQ